jgi:hypothetical protein
MNTRVSLEIIEMRDELVKHFNNNAPMGHVNANDVIELAVKELYKAYIDKPIVSKSKIAERYGVK